MNIYRVTLWKLILPNIGVILNSLISILAIVFVIILYIQTEDSIFLFGSGFLVVILLFLLVPTITLCRNYLSNQKEILIINLDDKSLLVGERGNKKLIPFKEIHKISKVTPIPPDYEFSSNLPWRNYYYYKLEIQEQEPIYITRFLIQKLETKIPIPCEYIHKKYPIIKRGNVSDVLLRK